MRVIAACALALLLGASSEAGAQARADAPRDGTVAVRATDGQVRVVGWSRAEVSATPGGEGDEDDGVRIVRERGVTSVRVRGSGGVVVRVPAGSRVVVKTRSGDISVEGVDGALDLESTTGGFRVAGAPRMVTVEGLSGDVEVTGSTETLRVRTVSGSVRVPRAQGFVEAVSVSGDVHVTGRLRRATLRSTSGRAVFAGSVPRDGSLHLESTSGIVELRLPAGIAADFDLSSLGGGQIESAMGPRPTRQHGSPGMATLRFSSGSGGAEITARTVSGVILLKKQ